MTIQVLEKTPGCAPEIFEQGDWYDLRLAEDVILQAPQANRLHYWKKNAKEAEAVRTREVTFDSYIASLGIAAQLPKGYEAIVAPRSSTFKKYGVTVPNSFGVIDNSYCGNDDVWKMPLLATRATVIPKGVRIAQFRIQLSQKATVWQKLLWLFTGAPKLKCVPFLRGKKRGGFGSTGEK